MIAWNNRDEPCEYANNLGVLVNTSSNEVISAVIKQDNGKRRFFSTESYEMPEIYDVTHWVDLGDVASSLNKCHNETLKDVVAKLREISTSCRDSLDNGELIKKSDLWMIEELTSILDNIAQEL